MMAYFRELPQPLGETDADFAEAFFRFANTYTEESILRGYMKEEAERQKKISADDLRELGYSEEDIMEMED